MSNINYTAIQTNYPVVGVDNSSQGFRDNFAAISLGLQTAKTEISALQTKGIFAADITASSPLPIVNDLLGSVLFDGVYNQLNPVFYKTTTPTTGSVQVDLNNGQVQQFTVAANTTFSFINWKSPSSIVPGVYTNLRLILIGDQRNALTNNGSAYTINFNNTAGHLYKSSAGYVAPSIAANGQFAVIDIFTFDAGANIFIRPVANDFYKVS